MTGALSRRAVLASAALLAAAGSPVVLPDGATLLVAGPGGGAMDGWAEWLTPGLARAFAPGTSVRKDLVGGVDGVTCANQFEARTVPDGGTAMLLPGSAAMAWLVGDPRARFDAGHWVATLAATTPSLVAGRGPVRIDGRRIRVAISTPTGPELPAMLALDLLGADWTPVPDLAESAAINALARGTVDVICLRGRNVSESAQALAAAGAAPLFSLCSQRDPAFPETPSLSEMLAKRSPDPALVRACYATAAASALDVAMVLPQLTPAALVALWRWATAQALGSDAVQAQANALGIRPMTAPAATASTAALIADTTAQLQLRRWLADRLNYRPS